MSARPELVAYGEHPSQVCELFLPEGEGPFGVVVLIHPGWWLEEYGRRMTWPLARDLQERGWAVWNVEYRRLGGGGGVPETLDDVGAAIDALGDRPEPLDPGMVVAVGQSAGGQLALWAASRPSPVVPVTAAAAGAGAIDLTRLAVEEEHVRSFLGGTPGEVPEAYALADPARHLPLGVPLLITHGSDDETVPVAVSEGFAERARAAGDDCTLVVERGEGHGDHLDPGSRVWRAVVDWLAAQRS